MDPQQGFIVTNADIYRALNVVKDKVLVVEQQVATLQTDTTRVRQLQNQVSAMWVVHCILIAFITNNFIRT